MKNEGDKTMKKVLLTSAAALAVFTVAPVFANGENPTSTNQLLQKKYVSERDIAEEANRQVDLHDNEIREQAKEEFAKQPEVKAAEAKLKAAEAKLKAFLDSGYSGHDFSDKKAALEAEVAAAKSKSKPVQTLEEIYNGIRNSKIVNLQKEFYASLAAKGYKEVKDGVTPGRAFVNAVEDNKPNDVRISEDQANQGTQAAKGWVKDAKGQWSYLKDAQGTKATGWLKDNGTWYYLNAEGVMQTGWVKDNGTWYYLDGSGAMQKGWKYVGGHWYYLDGAGAMQTGWKYVGGHWYYLNASGALLVNTTTPDGYKVNASGELV